MDDETARLTPGKDPPTVPPQAATVPLRYGRARLVRPLGRGGMGEVHLGFHEGFEIPVAVKLLPVRSDDPELVERFLREGRVLVRLDHPSIVRVFDVGSEGGRLYLVMEYVEGQDLEAYARDRGGRLAVSEVVSLIGQAARGIAYAHGLGVIHRDIKPANLMRRASDGRLKVLDFGLARAAGMNQLTSDGALMGTLPYMAYEQLLGHPGPPSDVFSLGVTLFRLLTGEVPAKGDLSDLLRFHREGRTRRLADSLDSLAVPEGLQDLLDRMLATEADRRPSAHEAADGLDRLLASMGDPPALSTSVGPPSRDERMGRLMADLMTSTSPGAPPPSRDRSRTLRRVLAILAGLGLMVAGSWALWRIPRAGAVGPLPGAGSTPPVTAAPGGAPWVEVLQARRVTALPLYHPYFNRKFRSIAAPPAGAFLVVKLRIPTAMRGLPADRPGIVYTAREFSLLDSAGRLIRNEDWVGWKRLTYGGSFRQAVRGKEEGVDAVFADDPSITYREADVPGTLFPGWAGLSEGTMEITVEEPELPGAAEDIEVGFLLAAQEAPAALRFRDQPLLDLPR